MQSLHELEKRADRHREEALKKLDALQQEESQPEDIPLVGAIRKPAAQH